MKLITRDTDYGIRAICFIAKQKPRIVSTDELVKELKMPKPFLRKILQILNKRGILKSFKGQSGGFNLTVPADKLYLVDLMKIFQGSIKLNECIFKKRICPNIKVCKLKKKLDEIQKYVERELKSITIESLMKGE